MSKIDTSDSSMTFLEHLGELRTRIIRFLIIFFICILVCYGFRKELLDIVKSPVEKPLQKYASTPAQVMDENPPLLDLQRYSCQCTPTSSQKVFYTGGAEKTVKELPQLKPIGQEKVNRTEINSKSGEEGGTLSLATVEKPIKTKVSAPEEREEPLLKSLKNLVFSFLDIPVSDTPRKSVPSLSQLPPQLSCQCTPNSGSQLRENKAPMVYLGLPELFFTQMKTAIFAGFFISFPFLIIQIWGFVGPALFKSEKKVFWWFSFSTYVCFIGGALFGYFIVFPYGFDFFLSLTEPGEVVPSLSIGQYLGLAIKMLIAFGVIFELPLMTFILARLGLLTPKVMIQNARMAFLVICVLSAILTPPDPFTMLLMAAPLIGLYMVSILVCWIGQNKQKAAMREQGLEE